MLDTITKRRIDTARDILVGKVPDPKSQVEQITLALIYKFMDDMDADSEAMGGERKFFAGDFARYGWAKLMRSGLSGHETLNLYAEAIGRMPENPGMPALFRDIFKNAYLPYRDPETLRAFLKVIDEFEYDHSERLGDAFEYLLSVLGSQGDAGQFRTPRHIIDFIVKIVDPQKSERVLDPACGTAGFLISAWKHILASNTDDKGNSTLLPDEKAKLAANFQGYDISPDMVRLSLANMYLHGFTDPHIVEYDTLTSDERWNEHFDVILANPPFMTPKGGIRPHNRFSISAKRSEVLFVDYMAEHLTPNGRAGIIVPEGIIFQSQGAYVQLRKMLVEQALVAVISLPAGVFQPYSGVKTSILILDKALAKQSDTIGFFKVESDGFSLGAQRRETEKNDLQDVQKAIAEYLKQAQAGGPIKEAEFHSGLIVAKASIATSADYNLSGERYRSNLAQSTSWPTIPLAELCEFRSGLWKGEKEPLQSVKILRNTNFTKTGYLDLSDIAEHPVEERQLESRLLEYGDIILEKSGGGPAQPVGRVAIFNLRDGEYSFSNFTSRIRVTDDRLDPFFLWNCLHYMYKIGLTERLQKQTSGIRNLDNKAYQALPIPLPPIEVQREIVAEIEGYQRVIDGARMVVENYRPHIAIDPSWPIAPLEEIVDFLSGGTPSKAVPEYWDGDIPWVSAKDMKSDLLGNATDHITLRAVESSATKIAPIGSILVLIRGMGLANGIPVCGLTVDCAFNQDIKALVPSKEVNFTYLRIMIKQHENELRKLIETAAHGTLKLNTEILKALVLPLPSLEEQESIASEIEGEQWLIAASRELIARFERKIQATLARVWGEEAPVAGVGAEAELVAAE